jgi:hypothetical protein
MNGFNRLHLFHLYSEKARYRGNKATDIWRSGALE